MIQPLFRNKSIFYFATLLLGSLLLSLLFAPKAEAFNKNRLIDDALFTDTDSLNQNQIQNWLNAEAGFLKSWTDDVNIPFPGKTDVNGNKCFAHIATGMTAAEIIAEAADDWQAQYVVWRKPNGEVIPTSQWDDYTGTIQSCRSETAQWPDTNLKTVSPKALLVTLQKEQSLISLTGSYSSNPNHYENPTWPSNEYALAWAMGYGVPDTGGKNHRFIGLYSQVNWAAWQLRFNFERSAATDANIDWDGVGFITYTGPMIEGNWKRCSSCSYQTFSGYNMIDGEPLYMENRATAALYYYTPHTYPGYYGNYNFVQFYSQWFGSVFQEDTNVTLSSNLDLSNYSPYLGESVSAQYTISNDNEYPVYFDYVNVYGRGPNNEFASFPVASAVTINPGESYTYNKSRAMPTTGEHDFEVAVKVGNIWYRGDWPANQIPTIIRERTVDVLNNPLLSSSLSITPTDPHANDNMTASFTIENHHSEDVTIPILKVAARDLNDDKYNFPANNNVVVPANGTYTYSENRIMSDPGFYYAWITTYNGTKWSSTEPVSADLSIQRESLIYVDPNPVIDSSLSIDDSTPSVGQSTTVDFNITNDSNTDVVIPIIKVSVRDENDQKHNFDTLTNLVVPASGNYLYSSVRSFDQPGTYTAKISTFDGTKWTNNYPVSVNGSIARSLDFEVIETPEMSSSLNIAPSVVHENELVTVDFDVTNNSDSPITVPIIKVAVRDDYGAKFNFPANNNVVINSGQTYNYSESRTLPQEGNYYAWVVAHDNSKWRIDWPTSSDSGVVRNLNIEVVDNPTITSSLEFDISNPNVSQDVTATFTINNYGEESVQIDRIKVAVRDSSNAKHNFGQINNLVIPAGDSYVYSQTRSFGNPDDYQAWITSYNGSIWSNSYPIIDSAAITTTLDFSINP